MSSLPAAPLSPLDGRYFPQVRELANVLSEAALNRARVQVEIEWLIFLADRRMFGSEALTESQKQTLRAVVSHFDEQAAQELAHLEATTQHDVKAVEYFVRNRLNEQGLDRYSELTHFACTSEDINNLAYALTVRSAIRDVWQPHLSRVIDLLRERALLLRDVPMLSRTHGQPATPTTVGKELAVFVYRLERIGASIAAAEYVGKFNGASGTFAAHVVADPDADWITVSREFVTSFGLTWNPLTTQIESHDWQVELYQKIIHAGRILHNLATDMWSYISLGYFRQRAQPGATGSSTMPHKVNPIRFENAEANLEISAAILGVLCETLSTSRLQRDLTDSTTQRNIGVGLGHSVLAMNNLGRGLEQVDLDPDAVRRDLNDNGEVLAEAIQTVIRAEVIAGRSSIADPYALLKEHTRGKRLTAETLTTIVDGLDISAEAKRRLHELTPEGYVGLASTLVDALHRNSFQRN